MSRADVRFAEWSDDPPLPAPDEFPLGPPPKPVQNVLYDLADYQPQPAPEGAPLMTATTRSWRDIKPADAVNLNLAEDLSIDAPLNELGERCPWPWEPQQLIGAPLGQYRCPYCMAMVVAGMPHIDYRGKQLP